MLQQEAITNIAPTDPLDLAALTNLRTKIIVLEASPNNGRGSYFNFVIESANRALRELGWDRPSANGLPAVQFNEHDSPQVRKEQISNLKTRIAVGLNFNTRAPATYKGKPDDAPFQELLKDLASALAFRKVSTALEMLSKIDSDSPNSKNPKKINFRIVNGAVEPKVIKEILDLILSDSNLDQEEKSKLKSEFAQLSKVNNDSNTLTMGMVNALTGMAREKTKLRKSSAGGAVPTRLENLLAMMRDIPPPPPVLAPVAGARLTTELPKTTASVANPHRQFPPLSLSKSTRWKETPELSAPPVLSSATGIAAGGADDNGVAAPLSWLNSSPPIAPPTLSPEEQSKYSLEKIKEILSKLGDSDAYKKAAGGFISSLSIGRLDGFTLSYKYDPTNKTLTYSVSGTSNQNFSYTLELNRPSLEIPLNSATSMNYGQPWKH